MVDGAKAVARYSPGMQVLHWAMAALMFAAVSLAWAMTSLPRTAPDREFWYTLHKSVGVTLFALLAVRLVLRLRRDVPAEPSDTPGWVAVGARISHWSLYAVLIVMPISGYVVSSAGGHAVPYFGLFDLPSLPNDAALQAVGRSVHRAAQWAVYGLVSLHVLATVWHVAVKRDGLLDRMIPAQRRDV